MHNKVIVASLALCWMKMILSATENAKDHLKGAALANHVLRLLSFPESVSSEKQLNEVEMKQ